MTSLSIYLQRIYEPSYRNGAYRMLIDRLWPRGISKEKARLDEWCREAAPSTLLRKTYHRSGDFQTFRQAYLQELADKKEVLQHIRKKAAEQPVELLYAAKNKEENHALVLWEALDRELV